MSILELLLRVFSELKPILPAMIAAVASTLLALVVLLVCSKNVWLESRRFHLVGLFFGLNGRSSLRLACVWLKLIFLVVFVVGFQKLTLLHYLTFLLPGLIAALCGAGFFGRISSLFWLMLQAVGLISVNLICGYIRDLAGGVGFVLVYVAMGVFLVLFSVYLFLNEVNTISMQRDIDAERVWLQPVE